MSPTRQTVVLDVEGMKCGGCVKAVERTLMAQPGVQRADVNLVTRSAWLDLAADDGDVAQVLNALADRGFPASERSLELNPNSRLVQSQEAAGWWRRWRQLMVALVLLVLSVLCLLYTSPSPRDKRQSRMPSSA